MFVLGNHHPISMVDLKSKQTNTIPPTRMDCCVSLTKVQRCPKTVWHSSKKWDLKNSQIWVCSRTTSWFVLNKKMECRKNKQVLKSNLLLFEWDFSIQRTGVILRNGTAMLLLFPPRMQSLAAQRVDKTARRIDTSRSAQDNFRSSIGQT